VDSALVRVNVGVVDGRGRPSTDLQRDNFAVFEDGVKQEITTFERTTAPFSVVMLLDMSGSTKSFRQNIQLAAARFLDALAPEDRVAVVEFYTKVNLLNNFTSNRSIALHSISVANGSGQTELYRALMFSLEKLASEKGRRKAIVVLSDGVDTPAQSIDRKQLSDIPESEVAGAINAGRNEALNRILDRADTQGVTIYPLALPTGDPTRLVDPTARQIAMYAAARERLKLLADRSGGTLNAINRLEELGPVYAAVAGDLRSLYTIEYQPANIRRDGKWRAIRIEIDRPELIARARQGYFAR
jgi:Ca-activated chloride channel homolog